MSSGTIRDVAELELKEARRLLAQRIEEKYRRVQQLEVAEAEVDRHQLIVNALVRIVDAGKPSKVPGPTFEELEAGRTRVPKSPQVGGGVMPCLDRILDEAAAEDAAEEVPPLPPEEDAPHLDVDADSSALPKA